MLFTSYMIYVLGFVKNCKGSLKSRTFLELLRRLNDNRKVFFDQTLLDKLYRGLVSQLQGPESQHEGPKSPREGLKSPLEGPNSPLEGPNILIEGPNIPIEGPNSPIEGPNSPIVDIRKLQFWA